MAFSRHVRWDCERPPERVVRVVIIVSVSIAAAKLVKFLYLRRRRSRNVERKLLECLASKSELRQRLMEDKIDEKTVDEITKLSFEELQERLRSGILDPVTVLKTYQTKALAVDDRINCVIQVIKEAKDWSRASPKEGPLFGIPISLKDSFPLQGYSITMGGCANLLGFKSPEDVVFLKVLKKAGAVPFVITNSPQTHLSFACVNPVFGFTGNPYDKTRTPGGSSGGESALLGAGGSIIGIGTDNAGSVRLPASFCGICALKPTVDRFSLAGFVPLMQTIVKPTYGPMSRDVSGVVAITRALCQPEIFEMDPTTPSIPFREELYSDSRPLRIGYYCDDGYFPSIPACHRAVHQAKHILQTQGHTVVPFQIPDVKRGIEEIGLPAVFGDAGEFLKQLLTGDVIKGDTVMPLELLWLPLCLRKVLAWFESFRDPTSAAVISTYCGTESVRKWWELTAAARMYRMQFIQEWQKAEIDCIICPASACVAFGDGVASKLGGFFSYTFIYNVVDFPAGVVPMTTVNSEDVRKLENYPQRLRSARIIKREMAGSEGLPVGVQCVALPFQEELVLRLMKSLETGKDDMGLSAK